MDMRIKASPQALYNEADEVLKTVNSIRQRFERIESAVTGSNGYWKGEAGEAHRAAYQDMKGTVEEIFARLTEHSTDLKNMAAGYTETETAAAEIAAELPMDVIL